MLARAPRARVPPSVSTGVAILPALYGHAEGTHDPDAEIIEHLAALLPWLLAA